jgi:hypothetical protein
VALTIHSVGLPARCDKFGVVEIAFVLRVSEGHTHAWLSGAVLRYTSHYGMHPTMNSTYYLRLCFRNE